MFRLQSEFVRVHARSLDSKQDRIWGCLAFFV